MAKCLITHACGHTRKYRLYGPYRERDRKAEWLENQDCPRCRAEREGVTALLWRAGKDEVQMIIYGYTYPMRHALKSRGYRFERYAWMERPGWVKRWTGLTDQAACEAVRDEIKAECAWCRAQGFRERKQI